MNPAPDPPARTARLRRTAATLGALLLLPLWVSLAGPWWSTYELDVDEGFNLIKAALLAGGHPLYVETWSDQPPVFTLLLAGLQGLAPGSVAAARSLVLAFAVLLLASLFALVRRREGALAAWVAALALAGCWHFQRYAVAVMIGLPALALAAAALALVDGAWHGGGRGSGVPDAAAEPASGAAGEPGARRAGFARTLLAPLAAAPLRQIAAGVLFGLALQTKLFAAVLLPLFVALAVASDGSPRPAAPARRRGLRLAPLAWAGGAAATTFLLVAVAFREDFLHQLLAPHVAPYWAGESAPAPRQVARWLAETGLFALLAAIGAGAALRRERRQRLLPLFASLLALLAVAAHRPLQPHHLLVVLVPMAWLAGIGGRALVNTGAALLPRRRFARAGAATLLVLALVAAAGPATLRLRQLTSARDRFLVRLPQRLASEAAGNRYMVADCPIDAFRAGLLVPPELAVYSAKRIAHGELTPATTIAALTRWQPRQVLLRRFRLDGRVAQYLESAGFERREAPRRVSYWVRPVAPGPLR